VAEVLDYEGRWSFELIETMLPVAIEIEANRVDCMARAVMGGLAGVLTKEGADIFRKDLEDVRAGVRKAQRATRGLPPEPETPAIERFIAGLRKVAATGGGKGRGRAGARHGRR